MTDHSPTITAEEFCRPTPVALYRHYDQAGELLYIGVTSDPARRWQQHLESSLWARFTSTSTVHWLTDRKAALRAERGAVVAERPLFNLHRPPSADPVTDHQISYLRTGVSGLPRRVSCRSVPGEFCISCGPDADAWLDARYETLIGATA